MRHASLLGVLGAALLLPLTTACNKETPKPDETKKSETTPVPSGLVFNDFLPTTGNAAGLGVRDAGLEGGLAAVAAAAGGGDPEQAGDAPQAEAKLKIVEPGSEPRSARKYTFAANRVEKRLLTVTQSVSQSMQGQSSPAQEMVIKLAVDLAVKQVKPTGALVEVKVGKVELPGAPPQVGQMAAALIGMTGMFEVSSHGEAGEMQFSATPQMKNQLAEAVIQSLSQASQLLIAPLPDAPIGVGATWELAGARPEQDQGAKRFTLKEATGDTAVVESSLDIKTPRRPQRGPGGAVMTVQVEGKGKYSYQMRFDRFATKVDGEMTLNEKIEAADPKSGQKQSMTQVQKVKHLVETPK